MDLTQLAINELINFFRLHGILNIIESGEVDRLFTSEALKPLLSPFIPTLVIIEFLFSLIRKKSDLRVYRVNFFIYVANKIAGLFVTLAIVAIVISLVENYAVFNTTLTWYWFIYGYIIWELGHYIYHFLCHKVRLFWCLHSTHHAPESMNLSLTYAHFFLEIPFAGLIRTTVCILSGVEPEMLFLIMFIDGIYGAIIHIGPDMLSNGRLGVFHKFILTPSHHRVHHAKNPLYIDTNYCNLLNIWDRLFRTYQEEKAAIPVQYGITRDVNSGSFVDVYFGEFRALAHDISAANGIRNKLLYLVMPPGWKPHDFSGTASSIRKVQLDKLTTMTSSPATRSTHVNRHGQP